MTGYITITGMQKKMITDNYYNVMQHISEAEKQSPFHQNVTLVAVSKTHPVSDILKVYQAGQRDFGENKVQELVSKYEELPKDIRWHMIGHLQTNKVKYIIDKVCMIHSVDSLKLAETVDKEAAKHDLVMPVLIEVNIGEEESKSGISASFLTELIEAAAALKHIKIKGLMCIPPAYAEESETRNYFSSLRNLSIDIKDRNIDNIQMEILSMGMSDDYITAISEGSNIVRVGTGIFGMRDYTNTKL